MKHTFIPSLTLLFFLISFKIIAQSRIYAPYGIRITIQTKLELLQGSVEPLMKLKTFKIKYNYDSTFICTFRNQEEYFNDLRSKYRAKKAERLINDWKVLPKKLLEPKFEKYFNKHASKIGVQAYSNVTYSKEATLMITILEEEPHSHLEAGYDAPFLIARCSFIDKNGSLIVSFLVKAWGASGFNDNDRREGSFTIAGNLLGKEVYKRLKKVQK
jgi:hypothetical protein